MGPNPRNDCMEASKIWKRERDTQPSENMETRKQDILPNGDWPWLYGKVLSSDSLEVSVFLFLSIQSSATFTFFPAISSCRFKTHWFHRNAHFSKYMLLPNHKTQLSSSKCNCDKGFFFPVMLFFGGGGVKVKFWFCYVGFILSLTLICMTSSWHWQNYWKLGCEDWVLSLAPGDLSSVDRYSHPGLPRWVSDKESACQCRRCGFVPWVEKISRSRKWQSTPVFLPGKFHEQRSLAGYCSWGCKRLRHNWTTKQQKRSSNQVEVQLIKLSCNPYFSILIAWSF